MKTTSASRLFLLSEGGKGSGGNLSGNGSTLLTLNFVSSFIFYFVFNFDLHNGTIKAKNWINPHPPCSHLFHRSREKAQPPHPAFSNGIFPLGGILLLEGTGLNCNSHLSLGWNQFHGSTWPDKPTFTSPGNSHPFPPCPTCPGLSRTTQLMSKHGGIIGRSWNSGWTTSWHISALIFHWDIPVSSSAAVNGFLKSEITRKKQILSQMDPADCCDPQVLVWG